ncbi:MAG: FAD-binding protein [Rhodospirillaceae bacterium]
MKDLHVVLIGAGIGGLTAAIALQRAGFKVSVHEQAENLLKLVLASPSRRTLTKRCGPLA